MSNGYRVASIHIVHEGFGDDVVILNLATGQYFGLNDSAAEIWNAIITGVSIDDFCSNESTLNHVKALVVKLEDHGLLVARDEAAHEDLQEITIQEEPKLEVYHDLADIIVADPIHEVDEEAGWPTVAS